MSDQKEESKTSRREFLKGAAVVGTGVLAGTVPILPAGWRRPRRALTGPSPWVTWNATSRLARAAAYAKRSAR